MKKLLFTLCLLLAFASVSMADRAQYMPDIVVTEPGAAWTDVRAFATLDAARSAIGATPTTLVISEDISLASGAANVTLPASVTVKVLPGVVITLGTYDLTINGSFEASNEQCFAETGSGVVKFTTVSPVILPAWFGTGNMDDALDCADASGGFLYIYKDTTITVPTDSSTLQKVFDHVKPQGATTMITVNIATGHDLTSGLLLVDGDWSQFKVTSTDAVVNLATTWDGVAPQSVLVGRNARMPFWDVSIDVGEEAANYDEDRGVISVEYNSSLVLGDGVSLECDSDPTKCKTDVGLFVYAGSRLDKETQGNDGITVQYFTFINVWITHNSQAWINNLTSSYAGDAAKDGVNVFVSRGSIADLFGCVSNGRVAPYADYTEYGLRSYRSRVVVIPSSNRDSEFNYSTIGIEGSGDSIIGATARTIYTVKFTENTSQAIVCTDGSIIDAIGSVIISPVYDAVVARSGGVVVFDLGSITTPGRYGLWAYKGGNISAAESTIDTATTYDIYASTGGKVTAYDATYSTIAGATGGTVVSATGETQIYGVVTTYKISPTTVEVTSTDSEIRTDTADTADNKYISLCGGGDTGSTRGSSIIVAGNESIHTGALFISAGDVTGGDIYFRTDSSQTRIFVEEGTGNVGIGDTTPSCKLDVVGAIVSATATITASASDTDVSEINTLFLNTTSGDIVVSGFTGGVAGQVLHVVKYVSANDGTLMSETISDGSTGGWTLVYSGTDWFEVSN